MKLMPGLATPLKIIQNKYQEYQAHISPFKYDSQLLARRGKEGKYRIETDCLHRLHSAGGRACTAPAVGGCAIAGQAPPLGASVGYCVARACSIAVAADSCTAQQLVACPVKY